MHTSFFKQKAKRKNKVGKVAKFSDKTKESIFERDWFSCIICWSDKLLTAHHAYYSVQSNRTESRNNIDQWVSLCAICHWKAHWCSVWTGIRQDCILYLEKYYGST